MKRNINLFIYDILENVELIENSIKNLTKEEFYSNKDIIDATIRRIEIIGEAVKNIPDDFRKKYPDVAWKKISGIRDIIIHSYFKVELEIVWRVIKDDIPNLKPKILKIKKELEILNK